MTFEIVDHTMLPPPIFTSLAPSKDALPTATYYLADVNEAQREVYDEHCMERYMTRSPYHYSSVDELDARERLGGDVWRPRTLHALSGGGAFVGLDGLVAQPPPPTAAAAAAGVATTAASDSSAAPLGRLYTVETLPGFNGLGRLMLALERLGLATISPDGRHATLRPADLTAHAFAATYRATSASMPEERGIENVHAFTYSKTFAAAGSSRSTAVGDGGDAKDGREAAAAATSTAGSSGPGLSAHRCLFVLEQFWTVNYWHWTTLALPKALLFAEHMAVARQGCQLLAYKFPWTSQLLRMVLGEELYASSVVFYRPTTLYYACRVLLPSPSALDAANGDDLRALRNAVLPHAAAAAASAAAKAAIGTRTPLVLLDVRSESGSSVHGAGRTLTNLPELLDALHLAFGAREQQAEQVVLFDHRGLSVAEQAALYARAAVVIGVHGAGFANALWAPSGAHIVEIVPIDVHLDFQCGLTPFWHTAELLGQRKHAFIAYTGRMFEPFALPVVEFIAFLRASAVL